MTYESEGRQLVVDCVQQVFQLCFNHADNLKDRVKYDTVGFIRLTISAFCILIGTDECV